MITNGRVREKEPNVAASFSELTHDVIELAELQVQLLGLDMKETTQKTRTSLILAILGVCMLLGSIPVALIALGEFLVEQMGWAQSTGLIVATLVGVVLSLLILAAAWWRLRSGMGTLQRSREELNRNIAWIKASLRSGPAAMCGKEPATPPVMPPKPR